MSWKDRVQSTIELVSPDGAFFSLRWSGDSRSVEKKLGVFTYPKVDGATVQDLGLAGRTYPLELFFDGDDNDLEATRFFDAVSARGSWVVKHPTKGLLKLQPVSITENIEPIESGSITVMNTEWLEPTEKSIIQSAVQLIARIRNAILNTRAIASFSFSNAAKQESVGQINAIKTSTDIALAVYDKTLAALLTTSGELTAQAESIRRGITATIDETPIDLVSLGDQFQSLVAVPAQVDGDLLQILKQFEDFISVLSILPDEAADQIYINNLSVREIFLVATISAMCAASTADSFITRAQVLEAADLLAAQFETITNALDGAQDQFSTQRIDQQYFSQSATFVETAQIVANTIKYLLEAAFDLAVEKRFMLDRERAPIEITITEYGSLGGDDSNFDLFVTSNRLKGNDILILSAGREVVIYVRSL